MKVGIEPTGFIKADECLVQRMPEYTGSAKGEYCFMQIIEEVVQSKLKAGHILSAKQTIDELPLDNYWREMLEEELKEAFETAEQIHNR